ncbi:hypothetical protein HG531_013568 [Fusarium graminearum]|nr:hypothetical protein HG531_013568 [Fusarium graminearum]
MPDPIPEERNTQCQYAYKHEPPAYRENRHGSPGSCIERPSPFPPRSKTQMPSSRTHELEDQRLRRPSRRLDARRLQCWVEPHVGDRRLEQRMVGADLRLDLLNDLDMSHHLPAGDDGHYIGVKCARYLSGALFGVGEVHKAEVRNGVGEGVVRKGEFLAGHDGHVDIGMGGEPISSNTDHVLCDVDSVDLRPDPGLKDDVSHDAGAACVVEDLGLGCQRL